jgi:hypothetical protein
MLPLLHEVERLWNARWYSRAIITTRRRFDVTSFHAACLSPCSYQRTASSCSSSRERTGMRRISAR